MAYLYVAVGKTRVVKVGSTTNVRKRRTALRAAFRQFGDELSDVHAFEMGAIEIAERAERLTLRKLAGAVPQYAGREWFDGRSDLALRAASIAAQETLLARPWPVFKRLTPDELAAREKLRKERVAVRLQASRERNARHAEGVQARRALREQRRAEIEARRRAPHGNAAAQKEAA